VFDSVTNDLIVVEENIMSDFSKLETCLLVLKLDVRSDQKEDLF
jgi:hypothetical protein